MARKSGLSTRENRKRQPAATAVSPVRPPAATPALDSTKDVTVEVPRHAPIVALLKPGDAAFHVGGDRRIWELGEGVLEVRRDGALIVVSSARCVQ